MRKRRGFTLIEVLAAMALIAVILPLAMQGISLATSLGGHASQRSEAAMLAKLKLDELTSTADWRSAALSGDFGVDWPDYRWAAALTDFDGTAVRCLEVQVFWSGRRGEQSLVMTTLVNTEGL